MMAALLNALREHAPRAWPWWAGVAATALALALLRGPAAQWEAQADEQLSAMARAARPASATDASLVPASVAVAPQTLPEAGRSPERSARLSQLARRHGVQVQRLREQWDSAGQLQLSLSGHAPYASWRAFTAAALLGDPALVLDRLHLQRPDASAAELDADTQWTFLHRGAADRPVRQDVPR